MSMSKSRAHDDYWEDRTREMLAHVDRTDLDVFAELSKIYSQGALDLQKELYAFYAKYAEDNGITYQEAQKRLRGVDLSDYQANAKRYRREAENDPELLDRLNEQYVSTSATRMDALALEMTWRLGKMRGDIDDAFGDYLKKTAGYIYRKAMGGHTGTINAPGLQEIVQTPFNGENYSQRIWGNVDNLAKDLRKTFETMFIRGENPRKAAQALAKRYDVARSRAETLLRTEGTAVISNATLRRYADAGLKYYRDLVHLDERTTDICRSIHAEDKRKLISEMVIGVNAAPYHFNCRTGIVPDDEEINQEVDLPDGFNAMSAESSDGWDWPEYDKRNVIDKDARNDLTRYAGDLGIALQGLKKFDGDVGLLRDYIARAGEVLAMFPNVKFEERRPLTFSLKNLQPDDFAITRGHIIELNSGMFRDIPVLEERYNSLRDSGWFAKGTSYKSIIDHEMGHVIDNKLNFDNLAIAKQISEDEEGDLLSYIGFNLSEYAASYPDGIEIPSEVFSSFMGNEPSSFALQFMKEVLKYR